MTQKAKQNKRIIGFNATKKWKNHQDPTMYKAIRTLPQWCARCKIMQPLMYHYITSLKCFFYLMDLNKIKLASKANDK